MNLRMSIARWLTVLLVVAGVAAARSGSVRADEAADRRKAQAMVDEVCRDVEKLRGLTFKRPVPLRMATRDDVETFVLGELEKQWPKGQMDADERTFKVLGLLPETYHLHPELVKLYREQVAGLYDPDADEMVLVSIDWLKSMTKVLLAHELTHALQDQHFDLGRLIKTGPHTLDRDFALSAVAEGDATLVMQDYMTLGRVDPWEMLKDAFKGGGMADSMKLLGAPPLMRHMLLSPYLYGMGFVGHFRRDGWEHVDRVYGALPLSAEQVVHPEKYYPRRDFPQRIDFDDAWHAAMGLVRGEGTDTTLGEIGVLALVESWGRLLKDPDLIESAERVAAGWDGDRLVSWVGLGFPRIPLADRAPGDGEIIVYWVSTWDTPEDAREMAEALGKWVSKWREGETDTGWRRCVMSGQCDVKGEPGLDVVCVLLRTRGFAGDFAFDAPYAKTVVRDAAQPEKAPEPPGRRDVK